MVFKKKYNSMFLLMICFNFYFNIKASLSPRFFQGKIQLSLEKQFFLEDFEPKKDKIDIITKINSIIDTLPNEKREFFIHILNMTMNVNMDKSAVFQYLDEIEGLTKANIALPQAEKTVGSFLKGIFSVKSIDGFFQEALAGDSKALEEIKEKAKSLKNVSDSIKREIIQKLEDATLAMVKKIDAKMKPMYDKMANLEDVDLVREETDRLKKLYDSQNYLVLKHCQDILDALEPMLNKNFQHFMFTYDRANNSALINLLDFRLIDLSKIKTDNDLKKTIDEFIQAGEVKSSEHKETQKKIPFLLKEEILKHHPDLVKIAEDAAKKFIKSDDMGKAKIMKSFEEKPYWQKEAISALINRYVRVHQQEDNRVHAMPEFAR